MTCKDRFVDHVIQDSDYEDETWTTVPGPSVPLPRNLLAVVAQEFATVHGSDRGDDLQNTCNALFRLEHSILSAHI